MAIIYLKSRGLVAKCAIEMKLAYANPVIVWGQGPCEGSEPSTISCDSEGVVLRRTRPGAGAAWKGSNVADRSPISYGGQRSCWSEIRSIKHAREKKSSPATASQTPILATEFMEIRRKHLSGLEPVDVLVGVIDDPFNTIDN